jgi:hypothetical protein
MPPQGGTGPSQMSAGKQPYERRRPPQGGRGLIRTPSLRGSMIPISGPESMIGRAFCVDRELGIYLSREWGCTEHPGDRERFRIRALLTIWKAGIKKVKPKHDGASADTGCVRERYVVSDAAIDRR